MDWFAKHEPVRKLFNFLGNLFNNKKLFLLNFKA